MPKCNLCWYTTKAKKIMKQFKTVQQKELAKAINISPQLMNYRIKNVYLSDLEDWIRLLNVIGYEIVEKEGN